MDIQRFTIDLPEDVSKQEEARAEIIEIMQSMGYRWLPSAHLFDRVKGRVFCFTL
jgi:hypothetical protein